MTLFKYFCFISSTMLMTSLCLANEDIEIRYLTYTLQVPSQPLYIVSSGGVDNGLSFLYELSHKDRRPSLDDPRISMRNTSEDELIHSLEEQENCSYKLFLDDIFLNQNDSGCSKEFISTYYNVLIQDSEYGKWPSQDLDIYYASGAEEALIIIIGVNKPNVLIQTNFLEEDQLKEIVSYYLQ